MLAEAEARAESARNELDAFGILVREPFEKRLKYSFTQRIISGSDEAVVYPLRPPCIVAFDSMESAEYAMSAGDSLGLRLSDRHISVVKV